MLTFAFYDTLWNIFKGKPLNSWNNCVDISTTNKLKTILVLHKVATLRSVSYSPEGEFWHLEKEKKKMLVKGLKV